MFRFNPRECFVSILDLQALSIYIKIDKFFIFLDKLR